MSDEPEEMDVHAKLRESKEYQDELKFLARTRDEFLRAFTAVAMYSGRPPSLNSKSLLFADSQDILESAMSYPMLVSEGILNAPRRELRYVLGAVSSTEAPVADRMGASDAHSGAPSGWTERVRRISPWRIVSGTQARPKEVISTPCAVTTASGVSAGSRFG